MPLGLVEFLNDAIFLQCFPFFVELLGLVEFLNDAILYGFDASDNKGLGLVEFLNDAIFQKSGQHIPVCWGL